MKTKIALLLVLIVGATSCAPRVACPAYTSQYHTPARR